MDITLVLVTLFSLVLAAVMTMLVWRLAREERRRSDVRNPDGGIDLTRLTAIVQTFDRDGGPIAASRAPVDISTLAPGMEAPFAVTFAGAADVGKYRVSFRTDDRLVPHVDRRDRAMAQAEQP